MNKILEYINTKMKSHGIKTNFESDIDDLIKRNVITNNMGPRIAYNTFVLYKSRSSKMFRAIVEKNHIFDITFSVEDCHLKDMKSLNSDTVLQNTENKQNTENNIADKDEDNDKDANNDDIRSIEKALEKTFYNRNKYIYVEKRDNMYFVGIILNTEAYEPIKNVDLLPTLIPYYLLSNLFGSLKKIHLGEKIYLVDKKDDVKPAFAEVMAELKGNDGMVMVSTYDIQFCETNLCNWYNTPVYLKNLKWPKDVVESNLFGEMAMCELFARSEHREMLEEKNAILKNGNFHFRLELLLEKNIKNKIIEAIDTLVKKEGENFWRKVRTVKYILGAVGAYPMHINDIMVDSVSLCFGKNVCGDGKFVEMFLESGFDMKSTLVDLDKKIITKDASIDNGMMRIMSGDIIYSVKVPRDEDVAEIVNNINMLCKREENVFVSQKLMWTNAIKLFQASEDDFLVCGWTNKQIIEDIFYEYDIILAKNKLNDEFEEIICSDKCDKLHVPVLGTYDLENTVLKNYKDKLAYFFSPCNECLYIKVLNFEINVDLVINTIILETNFNYIKLKKE